MPSNNGIGRNEWVSHVRGLLPHREYEMVVQAFNSKGSGPLSSPVSVTTREDSK